jgi:hypothetical protein
LKPVYIKNQSMMNATDLLVIHSILSNFNFCYPSVTNPISLDVNIRSYIESLTKCNNNIDFFVEYQLVHKRHRYYLHNKNQL